MGFPKLYGGELIYFSLFLLLALLSLFSFILHSPSSFSDPAMPFLHLALMYYLLQWLRLERKKVKIMLFIALAVSLCGVFIDVLNPGTFSTLTHRAGGFARNPNAAATTIVIIVFGIMVFSNAYNKISTVSGICLLAGLVGVVTTGSRGGLLCYLLLIISLLFKYIYCNKKSILVVCLMLISVPFIITQLELDERLLNRIAIDEQQEQLNHDSSRIDLLYDYVDIILTNFWGIGRAVNASRHLDAHNSVLNITAEFGWLAGGIFIAMVLVLSYFVLKVSLISSIFICLMISVMLFTSNDLFYQRSWHYFTAFLLFYSYYYAKRHSWKYSGIKSLE
ncbi:MAG: O-antigen ligase family protein [Pseudomonadales bacterium]|nr:O-antigen ligase family protein [Pseudomonadales bacterium]